MGDFKTLNKRVYDVCSIQELLQKELNYIEKAFCIYNKYPNWVIKNILQQAKKTITTTAAATTTTTTTTKTLPTTNNSRCSRKKLFFVTPL